MIVQDSITPAPGTGPFTGLSILALMADEAACGHYRIQYPMDFLARGGADIQITKRFTLQDCLNHHIILAQRQFDPQNLDIVRAAQRQGRVLIYEVDDNLHHVHPYSPAYQHFRPGSPVLKAVEEWLAAADGFFTSTAELASQYAIYTKRTFVLNNCIDFGVRDWLGPVERPKELEGRTVIGWAGGIQHQDDVAVLGRGLKRVLDAHPETILAVCSAQRMMDLFHRQLEIPLDRIHRIDPVAFDLYPPILGNFDIGLAPVCDSTFNRAKSALRCIEYLARKVPYCATKIAPYVRFHEESQGVGGFICDGKKDWLAELVEMSAEQRTAMGQAGHDYVRTNYSYEVGAWEWAKAIQEVIELRSQPDVQRSYSIPNKVGRNDRCPCGSGKKYKTCHLGTWG